jgi:putative transposase
MDRKSYPSDLRDDEWALLEPLIPLAETGGRKRTANMREVLNAIYYVLKSGCQWDMLPHDFPPKGTVYHYYNPWRKDGTWQRMNQALREELRQELEAIYAAKYQASAVGCSLSSARSNSSA